MGLKLNGATSGSIELDPQANLGSDRVITLNATGNSTLTLPDSNGTLDRLERAGNILQVVQNYITNTSSVTSAGQTDIPNFSESITPASSSSKILVRVRWSGELANTNNYDFVFRLKRNGTVVGNADTASSRTLGISCMNQGYWNSDAGSTPDSSWFEYLDSPNSTSTVTYQVCYRIKASGVLYTNRTVNDVNNDGYERLTSSITLIEVAG